MSLAMFRVMWLELWRDRGALALTFFLPPLVFLIFSSVFSGATGADVKVKIGVADAVGTPASKRLVDALLHDANLRAETIDPPTVEEVRKRVKTGQDDAALLVRADPASDEKPFLVVADPSRAVAAPITEGRVQQAIARAVPDALLARSLREVAPAIGPLTDEQILQSQVAQEELARRAARPASADAAKGDDLFDSEEIQGAKRGGGTIAYYAGATMILFALFSAMHGALSLMNERRSGIADRLLAGVSGMGPVVSGKFVFLLAQGIVQAAAIFLTAQIIYGVPVAQHILPWLATTVAAASCAAGISLGLVSLCRTRDQAQMLSTFTILVLAAIGGSMVPRFLMPPWLQTLGWFTPHAWVIDSYQAILWRDANTPVVYEGWGVLLATGAIGLIGAHLLARYVRR